ncbi:hypothetical protein [Lentzea cavernae]|uniref:Mycobacterium membrane protein n=1 Tax=Lentzea cavernae TaxID=2020703 RepID=A0ABQ3M055_9PSEU|nr:hypothetical protein [Lentzea cavernae]GHH28624.1 hypothetical protein GCM10017774_03130 [Lentzea cavernae]
MKTTLIVLVVLAAIGTGTAVLVNHFGGWNTLTGKAWAITYEVKAQPAETAVDVTFLQSPSRYRKEAPQSATVSTPLPWSFEVVIGAGEKARVSATPLGDQVLSCRILLDGVKELATATGKPGEEVGCETVTAS